MYALNPWAMSSAPAVYISSLFEAGSHVAQAGTELAVATCLYLTSAKTAEMSHQNQF